MFSRRRLLQLGATLPLATACKRDPELMVFAAASLREALAEVCRQFAARERCEVKTNYAGSNVLARQIESSRAADVYLSADSRWMDHLEGRRLLEPGTRRELLGNQLVVVARKGKFAQLASPQDLLATKFDRLVLADPEAVPAGRYARTWLSAQRQDKGTLWASLESRVVPTSDVRAALAAVAADPRRAGIVYSTDVALEPSLEVLYRVPVQEGPKIGYHIAQIRGSKNPERARAFVRFAVQPEAAAVFSKFGFIVPP